MPVELVSPWTYLAPSNPYKTLCVKMLA
jgi:hypothetical protein